MSTNIWRFPKVGVPPNHPLIHRMFHYKPSSYWGAPMTMETSLSNDSIFLVVNLPLAQLITYKITTNIQITGDFWACRELVIWISVVIPEAQQYLW